MPRTHILFLVALSLLTFGCVEPETPNCTVEAAKCAPKDAWPMWTLRDFQPASDKFDTSYGLEAFEGKTTVVVFLAGWCGYCQSQALELEKLQKAYTDAGEDVQIVAVNATTADNDADRAKLLYLPGDDGTPNMDTPRATFPMFQDTNTDNVWGSMGGAKDDFFIYRADGTLFKFLSAKTTPLDLRKQANVDTLKGLIQNAQ